MNLLVQIGTLMASLMFLVMLHEIGHFIPARWFGVRVERFFCFFDVKFAIWKKKIGDTVYGIGWLPLGGYVKLAGMIDESMDTEQMKQPPQPWEFRTKPAWQRLIIMLGGITVNFLLAIIIFAGLLLKNGEQYTDVNKLQNGIIIDSAQIATGLQLGDIPMGVDGKKIESLEMINRDAMIGGQTLEIKRLGSVVSLPVTDEMRTNMLNAKGTFLFPALPAVIDSVTPHSGASESGIRKGDKIVAVNGTPVVNFSEVTDFIRKNKGQTVHLSVLRNGKTESVNADISPGGKLGVGWKVDQAFMADYMKGITSTKEYGIFAAIGKGFEKSVGTITTQVKGIKMLIGMKDGRKQLAGPIGMVKQMPTSWDWAFFWNFTAVISAWLAFLNLLPIPALDGGHAVFALYEMITGRPANEKVLEKAQIAGVVILIGLMIFIFGNDILNAISG